MHALLCISEWLFWCIPICSVYRYGAAAACAFIMNYAKDDNTIQDNLLLLLSCFIF